MNSYKESIKLGQAKNQATALISKGFHNLNIIGICNEFQANKDNYKQLVKLIYKLNKEIDQEVGQDARVGDSK